MPAFIQDEITRNQYVASSGQTIFDYTFTIFDQEDVTVYLNGVLATITTDYTVTNVGVQGGGTIVRTLASTAGDNIILERDVILKRITDFTTSGEFPASSVNREFDRLVQMLQDDERKNSAAIKQPNTDLTFPLNDLPDEASRLDKVLSFNEATGQPETFLSSSVLQSLITSGLTQLVPDPSVVVANFTTARLLDGNNLVGGEVVLVTDIVRGGHFVVRSLTSQTDDDGVVLELAVPNGFYLRRLYQGPVMAAWFGVADGIESAAIVQSIIDALYLDVLLPLGTLIWETGVIITNVHNGLKIFGQGWGTHLQHIGDNDAANFRTFDISDASLVVKDIHIGNMQIDGNSGDRTSTSTRGIWTDGNAGTFADHIFVENVWAHHFDLEGISHNGLFITIQGYLGEDNGFHGWAVNSTDIAGGSRLGPTANISDFMVRRNGGLGFDISASPKTAISTVNLNNWVSRENAQGGYKLAGRGTVNMGNGDVYKNTGKGGRGQEVMREVNMTNVHFRDNTDYNLDVSVLGAVDHAFNTVYAVDDIVRHDDGKFYIATVGGTSAGSGGPTGRGEAIVDGTVTWDYWLYAISLTNVTSKNSGGVIGINLAAGVITANGLHDDNSAGIGIVADAKAERVHVNGYSVSRSQATNTAIDGNCKDQTFIGGTVSSDDALYNFRRSEALKISHTKLGVANGINSGPVAVLERLSLYEVDFTDVGGSHFGASAKADIHALDCEGLTVPQNVYTPTNVTEDRSYNADTVAVAELADVVGTLITDLQTRKLIG